VKRYLILIILVIITSLSTVLLVSASDISIIANQKFVVTIDGNPIDFSHIGNPMLSKTGRTFVPIRFMSKYLAYNGYYPENSEDISSQNVWINDEKTEIKFTLNKATALVDGKEVYIDYTPDGKPAVDSKIYLYEGRVYLPLRFICETFGEEVEYKKIGNVHHIAIATKDKSQDTKNIEDDFEEIQSLAGYIRIEDNVIHFNEVEIVEWEDQKRVKELGLNEYDMPNGYAIINKNKGERTYELADEVIFTFTDMNLDYVKNPDGNRLYTTTKKDRLLKYFEKSSKLPLSKQTIPYFIEVKGGKVISITEKFKYTI
jgi:hypothetical protein